MTVAETLAAGVRARGADTVFGLPGGGPNLEVIGAAEAAGLRFVLAHGETAACIMAATYGLLTGRPAMAIATRGPGAASAANGAAQATLDRYPLLLVTDCVPHGDSARVAHQRLDQLALMQPVTKWSGRLGGDGHTADVVDCALGIAAANPQGAVHLDFDPGASCSKLPDGATRGGSLGPGGAGDSTGGDDLAESIAAAAVLLAAADRPVAIVGFGAVTDAIAVGDALERLGCPVLTTYQAAGLLPEGHPQLAGLYTSGVIERSMIEAADLIITVGLDTVEPMPPPWSYSAPVISIDHSPAASTFLPTTVQIRGDIASNLRRLIGDVPTKTWAADAGAICLAEARRRLVSAAASGFGPLELAITVAELAPSNAIATVDAGAHFLAIMPFWPVSEPLGLLISNGLATMGFALPSAIAASLARPGRPVVCMVGDGGLGMTLAELETLARLQLPITVVVFNDAALSLIEIKQRANQGGTNAVHYRPIDFAGVASAMGLEGCVVTTTSELRNELAKGWDRPRLIDARIDPSRYGELMRATRG